MWFKSICLGICLSIFIVSSAFAVPLDTDFYPPDVYFSPIIPPITFTFIDSRPWTEKEKNIIREAFREWDVWICNEQTFYETTGDKWDISLRWAGADLFKNYTTSDYTRALGVWSGKPGEFNVPWDTNKFPLKEIYFNSQYFNAGFDIINNATWYIDDNSTTDEKFKGYDLLTVAKHEIGHALGIRGDWGQIVSPPAGKTKDEVMWGREDPGNPDCTTWGVRKHLQKSDLDELRSLGYHVVPEPCTLLLIGSGVAGIIGFGRKGYLRRRGKF